MTLLWLCHLSVPPAAESRKGFLQQHIIASICVFIFSLMNTILIEVRWDPIFLFVFLKWLMILSTFHVFVSHLCFFLRKCLFWPACSSLNWFFRYCWIVEFSWAPCMICLRILCQRHGFQTLFDRVLFVWFCFCCFGGLLQKKNCMAMSWSVSPMFSSSSIGLLYMNIQYSQQHVLKRLSFLLGMFGNFVKVHLTDDTWVNFWQLYTVPLVYVFFLCKHHVVLAMVALWCVLKFSIGMPPAFVVIVQDCFDYQVSGLLGFHRKLRIVLPSSVKSSIIFGWESHWVCFE